MNKPLTPPVPVLFILDSLSIGGNETSALGLAKNLDKNLFNPKVLVLSGKSSLMREDFLYNNIELIYTHSKSTNSLLFFLEFFAILKKYKIRVVMMYPFTYQVILLQFVSFIAGVRHRVLRISGSPDNKKLMKKLFFVQLAARFLITREVVVSNAVRNWILEIGGFPVDRISVICNGIKPIIQNNNLELKQINNSQIIMTSRMDEAKDQFTLISAMAKVQKKIPKATLILVGDGPLRRELELHSKNKGCKTSFLGFRKDVNELLEKSSIFLFSTKTEGFPNALLEAMAIGLPVIASDIPPCSEILNRGVHGLLFKVGDVDKLASTIIDLIQDDGKRTDWAVKARKRSKDYSMIHMVKEYQKIFSGILE